jgi:tetratricopeptide (TPR) repeat protein
MLETIRQFAEEALAATGGSDAVRDLHARYFADQADIFDDMMITDHVGLATRSTDVEMANLSAAFRWAADRGDVDAAIRIATFTNRFAIARLRSETSGWCEEILLAARRSGHRQLPRLLAEACDSATGTFRYDDAIRYGLEAIELNDDDRYEPSFWTYQTAGFVLGFSGDLERGLSVFRAGAEHPVDHPARLNLAMLHVFAAMGEVPLPGHEVSEALASIAASPMPIARAIGLWTQAWLAAGHDVPAAISYYQQAIDLSVDSGDRTVEQTCRGFQLGLLAQTDDLASALTGFATIVDAWAISGDRYTSTAMAQLVALLARLGYHDGAAHLLGTLPENMTGFPEILAMQDAMGAVAYTNAYQAGTALDRRSAAELAHQLITQARNDHTQN